MDAIEDMPLILAVSGTIRTVAMDVARSLDGSIATLTVAGRLTVTDTPGRLKAAALDAMAQGARAIILDLSQVPYIDSTRLGELITAHITVSRQQGRLVLVCTSGRIPALLKIAGLEGVFETHGSIEDARRALLGA